MSRGGKRSFFDTYPNEYDILTNAPVREACHRKEIAAIIAKFKPTVVLDAGCATGLTARLFAERSIPAVGLDRLKAMVDIAKHKHHPASELLSFRIGSFERIPKTLHAKFDLIVCLANSISGVGTIGNLRKALRGFMSALRPGGNLVLQMLNYSAVAEDEVMPVKATQSGSIIYERFTERRAKRLYLYITRLDLGKKTPQLEVFRHEMDNFSSVEIETSLRLAGFRNLKRYADLHFRKRFTANSHDLVLIAHKPAR
ncbi:MAG: class I SAM-dependent methyltransferase [Candidatus Zixiibacteriota bacterium]|nr:MAG: class I SAM-dependent methyltransferase [candidate division Zixibacteria bacterium]